MAKKLSIIFFIVIGVIIFAMATFCLILFLAPGLSVFGLKYIRSDVHLINTGRFAVADTKDFASVGAFDGDLIVEANEVPINVYYTQGYEYYFEYYDNFSGFTNSKFDDPSIAVYKDANGDAVIKVQEYHKIFETSSSKRYLNIYVPIVYTSNDNAYSKDLTIKTKSSFVNFAYETNGDEKFEDTRIPSHKNLNIETTSGKVKYYLPVYAKTYNLVTNNSVKLKCDPTIEIYATNYKIESKKGNVTFLGNVAGDIEATTKNGSVSLINCKNLIATTSFGNIKTSNKEVPVEINGIVKLNTKAGDIVIDKIKGNGENIINTGSGSVSISSVQDIVVKTTRGSVTIDSLNNGKIETNVGKVTVSEALSSINVSTKRGNIILGAEGLTINNPTVFSRLGKVNVRSSSGKVNISTISGKIDYTNTNSADITIVSGGSLKAEKLTGVVTINASKDIDISFSKITNTTKIVLADSCYNAIISANNNTSFDTRFYFKSANVIRYEDQAKVKESNSIINNSITTDAYISVEGTNATIHAYFKKPA